MLAKLLSSTPSGSILIDVLDKIEVNFFITLTINNFKNI